MFVQCGFWGIVFVSVHFLSLERRTAYGALQANFIGFEGSNLLGGSLANSKRDF